MISIASTRLSMAILTFIAFLFFSCEKKTTTTLLLPNESDLNVDESTPKRTLTKLSADTFRLNIGGNAFVYGFADQMTADFVVEIYDPNKKKIGTYDGPARGHERFKFTTTIPGIHRIVVSPFEQNTGDYSLTINGIEAIATDPEKLADQIVSAAIDEGETPGATVAVQQNGKIIFSKGYGYADLEYGIKNTPATIFHVASVSKQFTAFAIAMLADQGKIKLDDDIRKYIPELHDFGSVITIEHLVHHTSGLRDQWSLLMMAGWRLDDVITKDQIMRVLSRQTDLNFKPGDEMLYSNTGYTLMAEIVSRVTGEPFAEWCKKNIFDPLDMKSTLFYDDHEKIVKNRAYSYYEDPGGFKKSVLSYANAGATSLFTTVEDLSLWAVNFETMKVGNKNVMDIMNRRFILNNGDTIRYAFGQAIEKYKSLMSYSHGGADAGYRTFLLRFPEQHFSVCVFSNLASFDPGGLSYELANLYLADQMKEKPSNVPPPPPSKEEPPFDPKTVILSEFKGRFYSPELETFYTLDIKNDTLVAHHQRHNDMKLSPYKKDGFSTGFLGNLEFIRNTKGEVIAMKASNGRVRNLMFNKE